MGYLDVGISSSQSIANKASAGAGDFGSPFTVNTGGTKQSIVLYLVIGAVVLLMLWFKNKK